MRLLLAPLLALALVTAGCSTVEGAIGDAQDTLGDARESVEGALATLKWCGAAFRLGAAVASRDVEAGRAAAEDLETNAPEELQDELALILDAIDQAEAGDTSAIMSDDVRAAGATVLAHARERCDPSTDET